MSGNTCAKCGRKPAFWHPATMTYLCGQHLSEYRKRFARELSEDLAEMRDRRLPWWTLPAVVAVAALLWAAFILALGLAP